MHCMHSQITQKFLSVLAFDVEIKAKYQNISKFGAEASWLKIIFSLAKKCSPFKRNEH